MFELFHSIFLGITILVPLTNPVTTVALFIALSQNMTQEAKNKVAFLTSIYVFLIIVLSFYFGQAIMKIFGISIPGLRIAGGLIVAYIGFRMLFPNKEEDKKEQHQDANNIAFVPLALPSTAGPGTIAMVISISSTFHSGQADISSWVMYAASILVPLILSTILYLSLKSAQKIIDIVGENGIDASSRIMGFLLVCMGIQFIINGIKELVLSF